MKRAPNDNGDQRVALSDIKMEKKRRKEPVSARVSDSTDEEGGDKNQTDMESEEAPAGLVLKGGRLRLPDKLIEYLNKKVAPEVLYWEPSGDTFSVSLLRSCALIVVTCCICYLLSGEKLYSHKYYHNLSTSIISLIPRGHSRNC
jgi:hypothetical protein